MGVVVAAEVVKAAAVVTVVVVVEEEVVVIDSAAAAAVLGPDAAAAAMTFMLQRPLKGCCSNHIYTPHLQSSSTLLLPLPLPSSPPVTPLVYYYCYSPGGVQTRPMYSEYDLSSAGKKVEFTAMSLVHGIERDWERAKIANMVKSEQGRRMLRQLGYEVCVSVCLCVWVPVCLCASPLFPPLPSALSLTVCVV